MTTNFQRHRRTNQNSWLYLKFMIVEILKVKCGTNYKNQHKDNNELERISQLLFYIDVLNNALEKTITQLNEGFIVGKGRDPDPCEVERYEFISEVMMSNQY